MVTMPPLVTTYLEMRSPEQLRPKRCPDAPFQVREQKEGDGDSIAISTSRLASSGTGSTNDRGRMSNGKSTRPQEEKNEAEMVMLLINDFLADLAARGLLSTQSAVQVPAPSDQSGSFPRKTVSEYGGSS